MEICTICNKKFSHKLKCTNKFCSSVCYQISQGSKTPKNPDHSNHPSPPNKGIGIPREKIFIEIDGVMAVKIPLTRGKFAIIDKEDFDKVNVYKWHLSGKYATTTLWSKENKKGHDIRLHSFLLNPPENMIVDHANHDGLDNRRSNIRIASFTQNTQNSRKPNKCGYKGIYKDKNKWVARITIKGKTIRFGKFTDPESAAKKYDDLSRMYFGEFALTNF